MLNSCSAKTLILKSWFLASKCNRKLAPRCLLKSSNWVVKILTMSYWKEWHCHWQLSRQKTNHFPFVSFKIWLKWKNCNSFLQMDAWDVPNHLPIVFAVHFKEWPKALCVGAERSWQKFPYILIKWSNTIEFWLFFC